MLFQYTLKVVFIILLIRHCYLKSPDSYGPYVTTVSNFTECSLSSGTKARAAHVNLSMTHIGSKSELVILTDILRPVGPVAMRTKMFKWNGTMYLLVNNYRIKNICQHFMWTFVRPLMPQMLEKKCTIPKGTVNFVISDFNKMQHQFTGNQFFYGKFRTTTNLFTTRDNIVCFEISNEYLPV